ncbi:unnamed protein product [Urochloa decumbens]|uniref:Bifunctional inhibitor/plant lipid transfer protein/seed storage helical domain-containing protein n=1 Tax=Urochloa decumbens TaxID=240449 RepID=A0ABC9GEM3_9POAL
MLLGKVSFLLLVLCSVLWAHQVKGEELPCTDKQKKDILETCHEVLARGSTVIPHKDSPCCRNVRELPHNGIRCIIKLLTVQEREDYMMAKIQILEYLCSM